MNRLNDCMIYTTAAVAVTTTAAVALPEKKKENKNENIRRKRIKKNPSKSDACETLQMVIHSRARLSPLYTLSCSLNMHVCMGTANVHILK